MLVISAHAADFVWRAGGVVALHTSAGGTATVVSLSYGERGESGDLWREPGQTIENVRSRRQKEAARAADLLGAAFIGFDLGDYPLVHRVALPVRDDEGGRQHLLPGRAETGGDVLSCF